MQIFHIALALCLVGAIPGAVPMDHGRSEASNVSQHTQPAAAADASEQQAPDDELEENLPVPVPGTYFSQESLANQRWCGRKFLVQLGVLEHRDIGQQDGFTIQDLQGKNL